MKKGGGRDNLCCPDFGAEGGFKIAEEEVLPRYWQPQEPIQEAPASQARTEILVGCTQIQTQPHQANLKSCCLGYLSCNSYSS